MSYHDWSAEEAARHVRPVTHIRQRLKLAQLIPEFFDMLKKGRLRVSMALRISSLPKANQKKLLEEEKLTIDKVEKGCRSFKLDTLLGEDDLFNIPEIERGPLKRQRQRFSRLSKQARPTPPFFEKRSCSSTGTEQRKVANDPGIRQKKTWAASTYARNCRLTAFPWRNTLSILLNSMRARGSGCGSSSRRMAESPPLWVGKEFYPFPSDFIEEVRQFGAGSGLPWISRSRAERRVPHVLRPFPLDP